jgi:ankyrin repeat protein
MNPLSTNHCFFNAAREGDLSTIKRILEDDGFDPNQPFDENSDDTLLYQAVCELQEDIVQVLLNNERVNVNKRGSQNLTPFWVACNWGYEKIVAAFLKHPDTDIGVVIQEFTPLDRAILCNKVETVEVLLKDPRFEISEKALSFVKKKPENNARMIQLLLDHRRDSSLDDQEKESQDKIQRLNKKLALRNLPKTIPAVAPVIAEEDLIQNDDEKLHNAIMAFKKKESRGRNTQFPDQIPTQFPDQTSTRTPAKKREGEFICGVLREMGLEHYETAFLEKKIKNRHLRILVKKPSLLNKLIPDFMDRELFISIVKEEYLDSNGKLKKRYF